MYDSWCFTIMMELDAQGLYVHRKHVALAHIYGEAPVAVEAARAYFLKQLGSATEVLRGSASVLGGGAAAPFSAADLLLTHVLLWARDIGWLPDDPALAQYIARNTARPAFGRLGAKKREAAET